MFLSESSWLRALSFLFFLALAFQSEALPQRKLRNNAAALAAAGGATAAGGTTTASRAGTAGSTISVATDGSTILDKTVNIKYDAPQFSPSHFADHPSAASLYATKSAPPPPSSPARPASPVAPRLQPQAQPTGLMSSYTATGGNPSWTSPTRPSKPASWASSSSLRTATASGAAAAASSAPTVSRTPLPLIR